MARRRADEVLARIAALEASFDRVEDRAAGTPPTCSVDDINVDKCAGGSKDAASSLVVESTAGAASLSGNPTSILDPTGEVWGDPGRAHTTLCLKQITRASRHVVHQPRPCTY